MTDLDTLLTDALRNDAERAPAMPDEWDLGARPLRADPRRRPAVALGIAAAMVLVIGTTAWFVRGRGGRAPAGPATTWRPAGTEYPLTDLGPGDRGPQGPVPVGLTHTIGVGGVARIVTGPGLTYLDGPTAVLVACVDRIVCRGEWQRPSWSVGSGAVTDERGATLDLLVAEGLPDDVAFVTYERGEQRLWQRPVAGVAAFPSGPEVDASVVGYDETGVAVGHFDLPALMRVAGGEPDLVGLSPGRSSELRERTRSGLFDCFHTFGGLVDDRDIATFPAGVDQQRVWDECVAKTKAAVGARVAELTARS